MSDLRTAVEGLDRWPVVSEHNGETNYGNLIDRRDVLALIPEGSVLVTEKRLADEMHTEVYGGVIRRDHPAVLHGENVDCECETWAASILARIREGAVP